MTQISLEEYKAYLVNNCIYQCDNTKCKRIKRLDMLNNNYEDKYLESIISGTYDFVNKILEMTDNNYNGTIEIFLEKIPDMTNINLGLTGGWMSDVVVNDCNGNFYSVSLLKKIFGDSFYIEPFRLTFDEEIIDSEDLETITQVPLYSLYIQCRKEIIDEIKDGKVLKFTK